MNDPRTGAAPLIEVQDLSVHFPLRSRFLGRSPGLVKAVDGVSFTIAPGETLGLVGESGSGKTSLGRALLRLVERTSGRALYRSDDRAPACDLFQLGAREMRAVRRDLTMIFQDPVASLNPRLSAGEAVGEVLHVHQRSRELPRASARASEIDRRVDQLFLTVGLSPDLCRRFPHELSGGQRQRVGIARALALEPRLIVCDEAVSALDVSVQAQILQLLLDLKRAKSLAYLFIAHDLAVVRALADRVAVMYLGRIVETGTVEEIFERARHPYTQSLLAAMPSLHRQHGSATRPIRGDPPSPIDPPRGCAFHPRCPLAEAQCRENPPVARAISATQSAACHLVQEP